MSERMNPLPFKALIEWMLCEKEASGAVFGVSSPYVKKDAGALMLFGEKLEAPFGPAAGPNTQLAENIIAGYYAGARFFELKTVQKMDGEELAACISRPCILANDEGYNCEWSTELTVPQAFEEYVKAYLAIKLIAKLYDLGDPEGFQFNMSVGYDLAGIKTEKIDAFIEGMKDASSTPIWAECMAELNRRFPDMGEYFAAISPAHSNRRDRIHAARLPAGRNRGHSKLPYTRKGAEHLRKVQPNNTGLRFCAGKAQ